MTPRRAITRLRAPDETRAEERAWEVVRAAHQERLPVHRRASRRGPAVLTGAVLLAGAMALSPAGATVGHLITRALGIRHASPALFSLPARGRLLVSGRGGAWIVASTGSARRLGPWTQASWSPHGLYAAVAAGDHLAAVDPRGIPRWMLARRAVSDPRWFPPIGYRVAYLSGRTLRVVAGDGTGDRLLATRVANVAPAWRPAPNWLPGEPDELAYLTASGEIVARNADTGARLLTIRAARMRVSQLAWSTGGRLFAFGLSSVRVYSGDGRRVAVLPAPAGASIIDGALAPDGRSLALVVRAGNGGAVVVAGVGEGASRRVLSGSGLGQVTWSPDGRWLLVSWPAANQWVFVRVSGPPRLAAVSRIAEQFGRAGALPVLDGWCCTASGVAG